MLGQLISSYNSLGEFSSGLDRLFQVSPGEVILGHVWPG